MRNVEVFVNYDPLKRKNWNVNQNRADEVQYAWA